MKNGKRAGSPYNIISLLFIKYNVTSDTYVGYEKLLNNLNLLTPYPLYNNTLLSCPFTHRLEIDFFIIICGILLGFFLLFLLLFFFVMFYYFPIIGPERNERNQRFNGKITASK